MEENKMLQLHEPRQRERLKWFTVSHFVISIIGVIGMFLATLLDGYMIAVLLVWEVVLLALYWVAGTRTARKKNWCRPQNVRERLQAFLSPALVAWIWGGLFLLVTAVPGIHSGLGDAGDIVAMIMMWSLLILAFPSSWGFAMLFLVCGATDSPPVLFLLMVVVGAVPPALFLLGSVLGVRKTAGEEPAA